MLKTFLNILFILPIWGYKKDKDKGHGHLTTRNGKGLNAYVFVFFLIAHAVSILFPFCFNIFLSLFHQTVTLLAPQTFRHAHSSFLSPNHAAILLWDV